jgi:hypothetical protein
MTGGNHTGIVQDRAFRSEAWTEFVAFRSRSWATHTRTFLHSSSTADAAYDDASADVRSRSLPRAWVDSRGRPVRVIFFELLRADPSAELTVAFNMLRELADLANCKVHLPSGAAAAYCALHSKVSPTTQQFMRSKRRRRDGNSVRDGVANPFSVQQIAMLCELAREFWMTQVWGPCDGSLAWERGVVH